MDRWIDGWMDQYLPYDSSCHCQVPVKPGSPDPPTIALDAQLVVPTLVFLRLWFHLSNVNNNSVNENSCRMMRFKNCIIVLLHGVRQLKCAH